MTSDCCHTTFTHAYLEHADLVDAFAKHVVVQATTRNVAQRLLNSSEVHTFSAWDFCVGRDSPEFGPRADL